MTTKAETVYERIEAMVASGIKKSDAFKTLAEEFGQPVNSVRGLYYTFSKKENGGTSKPRRRETTTADAVASAISALRKALADIDREVEAAKTRAEEAQAEYKALAGTAKQRKEAIEIKIAALEA
jgi:hypothetical protein